MLLSLIIFQIQISPRAVLTLLYREYYLYAVCFYHAGVAVYTKKMITRHSRKHFLFALSQCLPSTGVGQSVNGRTPAQQVNMMCWRK